MQLTPIGTSPAWYNPGEPTTGFLLQAEGLRVLVDCGAGVIARYLAMFQPDPPPLDAIVVTHAHADHVGDLVPLKYGIDYGSLRDWKPQLWLPPGCHERLRTLVSAWDGPADFFAGTYDLRSYEPGAPFEIGPLLVDSVEVPHFIEAFALRFEHRGATFAYTSDLGPCEHVSRFAQGVDLLLCEATLANGSDEAPDNRGHLAGDEAGAIAQAAGVHSLLLTHVPEEVDVERTLAMARSTFAGPVARAMPGECYAIAQRLAQVG